MAILRGPVNPKASGVTTFPDLNSVQVTAPNRHSVRPSLLLDFANSKTLDPRVNFFRGSNGSYFDGSVVTAEHNLIADSQIFTATTIWSVNNSTIVPSSGIAPDGTNTATKIVENSTTNLHGLEAGIGMPSADGEYTLSIYAKAAERSWLIIDNTHQTVANYRNWFNLSNGTVGTVAAGNTASIVSVGNGWYRCSVTRQAGTLGIWRPCIYSATADNTPTYAGNGSSGILIWGAQLERNSSASAYVYTNGLRVIRTAPKLSYTTGPRFTHNPLTMEPQGIMVEKGSTNIMTYSSQWLNASSAAASVTFQDNATIAPDGTMTATLVRETDTTAFHYWWKTTGVAMTPNTQYTMSVYLKNGNGYDTANMVMFFNNVGDTITSVGTISSGEHVGNGWYRHKLTFTSASTISNSLVGVNKQWSSFAGSSSNFYYVWGLQLEVGSYATSYIPTRASTVTRNSDDYRINGNMLSTFFNQKEGTIFVDATPATDTTNPRSYFGLNRDGTAWHTSVSAYRGLGSQDTTIEVITGQLTTYNANVGSNATRLTFSYSENNTVIVTNTATGTPDISTDVPQVNQLQLGNIYGGGSFPLGGTIKKFAYYPKRFTTEELQGLVA